MRAVFKLKIAPKACKRSRASTCTNLGVAPEVCERVRLLSGRAASRMRHTALGAHVRIGFDGGARQRNRHKQPCGDRGCAPRRRQRLEAMAGRSRRGAARHFIKSRFSAVAARACACGSSVSASCASFHLLLPCTAAHRLLTLRCRRTMAHGIARRAAAGYVMQLAVRARGGGVLRRTIVLPDGFCHQLGPRITAFAP